MVDPPYAFREPLRLDQLNHVINDVYVRNRTGKKWHRVYRVAYTFVGNPNPRLGGYGRSLMLVCGGAAYDREPDEDWTFEPTPVRIDVPGPDEICKACRQSDARYGKGDIPNTRRWDR
jgi:hypothetical protein